MLQIAAAQYGSRWGNNWRQLEETESPSVRLWRQCLLSIRFVYQRIFVRLCDGRFISQYIPNIHSSILLICDWRFVSFDSLVYISEVNDGQKRRRLEAAGQENRSPKASTSGRLVELETKADTPIVPSVRSRVQQLTQRREGNNKWLWLFVNKAD